LTTALLCKVVKLTYQEDYKRLKIDIIFFPAKTLALLRFAKYPVKQEMQISKIVNQTTAVNSYTVLSCY